MTENRSIMEDNRCMTINRAECRASDADPKGKGQHASQKCITSKRTKFMTTDLIQQIGKNAK